MVNKKNTQKKFVIKTWHVSVVAYLVVMSVFAVMIYKDNSLLNMILLGIFLFIAGLGIGYQVARDSKNFTLTALGTIAVSALIAFVLFLFTIFIGWPLAIILQ